MGLTNYTDNSHKLDKFRNKYNSYDVRNRIPPCCVLIPEEYMNELVITKKIPFLKAMRGFRKTLKNPNTPNDYKYFPWFSGCLVLKEDLGELED